MVNSLIEDIDKIERYRGLTIQEVDKSNRLRFWYMEIKQKLKEKI